MQKHTSHEREFIPITEERAAEIEKAIDSLSLWLKDAEWRISGGLSIPFTLAAYHQDLISLVPKGIEIVPPFYRDHQAIHIACRDFQLEKLVEEAKKAGFELFKRSRFQRKKFDYESWIHKAPRTEEKKIKYEDHDPISVEKAKTSSNVRFLNRNPEYKGTLLEYLDLFIHRFVIPKQHGFYIGHIPVKRWPSGTLVNTKTNDEVDPDDKNTYVLCSDKNFAVPNKFYRGLEYKRKEGLPTLKLIHPVYMLVLKNREIEKKGHRNDRDLTDRDILLELIEKRFSEKEREEALGLIRPKPQ